MSTSKFAAALLILGALVFSGAAVACDDCNYGGRQIYSCNAGQYDCRYETSRYIPRVGDCDDGCHGYRSWDNGCGCYRARVHAYIRGYRHGFRDGYETASYGDEDGFYDDDHHWRHWERWHDGDGRWRDGWHDDKGGWHDRDLHHDGQDGGWRDGDRRDDHRDGDGHDDHHDGDHHDGDHHDGDARDDRPDRDHNDHDVH
jgi:hypothetical protein